MKEELRIKLEQFIRRYYQNRLVKGLYYGIGLGALYFILLTILEWAGRFPGTVRAALFGLLVLGMLVILGRYILVPLAKLMGIGRRITYDQAAQIIGRHFPEVDDKLLNTLQLQSMAKGQSELLEASIDQRISELRPVAFHTAIDLGENKKYWPFLVAPLLIFAVILLTGSWEDFNQSSRRIAEFNREFVPEAPFNFMLRNENLKVEEGEDLELILGFSGSSLPAEANILINDRSNRMTRKADGNYHFKLNNLTRDISFRFEAAGWRSRAYQVEVVPVPRIRSINVSIVPPAYTGIKPSISALKPVMDVPEGSLVSWQMELEQSSTASLFTSSQQYPFTRNENGAFTAEATIVEDWQYAVKLSNQYLEKTGISEHSIEVIADRHPEIRARFEEDSLAANRLYISGEIADDYGFGRLELLIKSADQQIIKPVPFSGSSNQAAFADLLMLDSLVGEESEDYRLFLRVWDNDAINGSKSATSRAYELRVLGREEREEQLEEEYEKYLSQSEELQNSRERLEDQITELKKDIQGKKKLSWQDKSRLKELLNKQKELLKQQQKREEKLKEMQREEDKLGEKDESLKEKEEEINKIEPEDKKLQDLMKEIEELMEELNTDQLRDRLEEMQELNEQNQEAEQRKDELLKDLEFQKDVLKEAQKLNELSKEMKKLAKDLDENRPGERITPEQEMEKQREIEEEFQKSMEKLEKLKEDNKAFGEETEKEGLDEKKESTEEEMQEAQEKMQQEQQSPANQNQQNAGDKMQEMSESLQMAMMNMQSQQNKENLETLRQILENLKTLSFSIEELSEASRNTSKEDPAFRELLTEQKRLQDGTKIIEDSLIALGKRVPELEQVVFEESEKIEKNLDEGIQKLEELQSGQAAANQQMVMTSANNLSLLLDETMQSLMQAQAQMMKGNQNCQKPGGSSPKPSLSNMRKMQGELGKKMDQMQKGKKQGKGKDGDRMSKEVVEMLSRQEQLRQALEGMLKDTEGQGSKGDLQKAIEEMKKLEKDLWDGVLDNNYKQRLKNIDTRLLESEKAELKQKQEKRRESETADDQKQIYQQELEKYLREKGIEQESLDRVPINFRLYYRNQTNDYLKTP